MNIEKSINDGYDAGIVFLVIVIVLLVPLHMISGDIALSALIVILLAYLLKPLAIGLWMAFFEDENHE